MTSISFARKLQAAKKANKGQGGFSIVEAAVAVAIAGILTAAALPSFRNALGSAKLMEAKNQVSALSTESYADAISGGTGAVPVPTGGKWSYTLNTYPTQAQIEATSADGTVTGCVNFNSGARLINGGGAGETVTPVDCSSL